MGDKLTMQSQEIGEQSFTKDDKDEVLHNLNQAISESVIAMNEQELEAAKNLSINTSKNYTDQEVSSEATARDRQITEAVNNETQERSAADQALQSQVDQINNTLDGIQAVSLIGALLTRVINGTTPVAKNLFDTSTVFVADKTLISDINGTIGVYKNDIDGATINIETITVSPISTNEPTLLGNVALFSRLPLTVDDATAMGWNTPRIDDYARVLADETNEGKTAEWYITEIDADGNITWGNPVIINTSDYQAQTTAADSGRVLTGGVAAGTFGGSLGIDATPTQGSGNLIDSKGVYAFIQQVINNIFLASHPVGSIYITVSSDENTAAKMQGKYGGAWAAWGQGRVPLGVGQDGGSNFNLAESKGGSETHVLTTSEMPSHTHTQNSHNHPANGYTCASNPHGHSFSNSTWVGFAAPSNQSNSQSLSFVYDVTATNQYTGGGNGHNNLQPYITCYMWKRTA